MAQQNKRVVLDFSKPLPVFDEESGEYLGYWMGPDGVRVEAPGDGMDETAV
ncbi:hypothetical protein [Streptomyces sp. CCM_MD2014]|uniref:hypothetical protein n=1 Tax=Streptomyces sp. CCM_MD2014 TaxID=1561022 RepID=UPI000A68C25C|nr:hypothetical protein [Streptomyces sp. CCM_MD2014]